MVLVHSTQSESDPDAYEQSRRLVVATEPDVGNGTQGGLASVAYRNLLPTVGPEEGPHTSPQARCPKPKGNRTKARVRVRVEHVFGSQANDMGGTLVRSIGGHAGASPHRLEEPGLQHAPPHVPRDRDRGHRVAVYFPDGSVAPGHRPRARCTSGLTAFPFVCCKLSGTTSAGSNSSLSSPRLCPETCLALQIPRFAANQPLFEVP